MEAFPTKVKSGELATSSNLSWQFCHGLREEILVIGEGE
jgi:hypothetical protein